MAVTVRQLSECVEQIAKFSGTNLGSKITELEFKFAKLDKAGITEGLKSIAISEELMDAARTVKRAAAQIDVVLHALGILVHLPKLLEDGERIESLSLGAGSTESKRFDLETDRRVAEFTFIDWRGNDNTRLQKIFKDFYRLVEFETNKAKELWVTDDTYILKYLRSGSSIRSATHKHRDVWESFQAKYPEIEKVSDYYRIHNSAVKLRIFPQEVSGLIS